MGLKIPLKENRDTYSRSKSREKIERVYRKKQLLSSEKESIRLKFGYFRDIKEVVILSSTLARIPWTANIIVGHFVIS